MNDDVWRVRRRTRIGNGVTALALSAALLGVLGAGAGGVPALGRLLVPGHGAWDWRYTLLPAMTRPVGHIPALAGPALAGPALAGPALPGPAPAGPAPAGPAQAGPAPAGPALGGPAPGGGASAAAADSRGLRP